MEQEFVKKKNEVCSVKEFSDTILYNVDAYIILVDRNFLVEKTNYYNLNNTSEGQVLRRVGELLRCKNGLDAGACGSHENCKVCPVRNSIEKCFREKGHFSPLETPMRLYMSEKMDNYVDCIVCVSGTYLQLDQDDKVLLTVRDVTRQKKILDELEEARRNAEWAGEQGSPDKSGGKFFNSIENLHLCTMNNQGLLALAQLILPSEILSNFEVVRVEEEASLIRIYLDESVKAEYKENPEIESKGFCEAVTIRDFPIRDKGVDLIVRRRKWYDKQNNRYFSDSYDLKAEETRYSKEFAAFLKGVYGDDSYDLPFA